MVQSNSRAVTSPAGAPADSTGAARQHGIVTARAGDQRFGFLAQDVIEVQRMVAWEPLPGAPAAVEGVIDLRGRIVPVLDLLERLGLETRSPRVEDRLVVATTGRHVIALRVEEVLDLLSVPATDLDAAADLVPGTKRIAGVVRLRDGLVVVADLHAFLGWDEAELLDQAIDRAATETEERE